MPVLLSMLFSRAGLVGIALVGLLAVFGVQEVRLKLAQHGEAAAKSKEQAVQTSLDTCNTNLKAQEQAVQALKAAGDRKLAAAAPLPAEARSGAAKAQVRRDTILAVKPVDDRCAFARSVDAAFMAGLK